MGSSPTTPILELSLFGRCLMGSWGKFMKKYLLLSSIVIFALSAVTSFAATVSTTTTVTTIVTTSDAALAPLVPAATPETVVITPAPSGKSIDMIGGIGGGYYYLFPKDSELVSDYKGALTWKAFLEFKGESGLSLLGDVGIYTEDSHNPAAVSGTALTIIPATVSLAYHFFNDSAVTPFIGGGVGLYNINESDPDFNYLKTTKFGKHIFAGLDVYLNHETLLRGELRQTFIDPVNSSLYYQANFGGITATISLAVEWPLFGPEAAMTPEERALAREQQRYELAAQERARRLDEMEFAYRQPTWDNHYYTRWHSRESLNQQIIQTQIQMSQDQTKAEELKQAREAKRQQYLQDKENKRQVKKEAVQGQKR